MNTHQRIVHVLRLGRMSYNDSLTLMMWLVQARRCHQIEDVLLIVEHDPIITLGRGGGLEDIPVPLGTLTRRGVEVVTTDRGGRATYHGPGQLVVYPILEVETDEVYRLVASLESATVQTLRHWGVESARDVDHPGVWVGSEKIGAVGLAVQDHVTYHGLSVNISVDLAPYEWIIPCGLTDRGVTSLKVLTAQSPSLEAVARLWLDEWSRTYGVAWEWGYQVAPWLVASAPSEPQIDRLYAMLRKSQLHTVCEEAICPNLGECWGNATATFMLSGAICTRHCRFCAVTGGHPKELDPAEPFHIARSVQQLALDYVVLTSVTRDDLEDGGAEQFARTIRAIRRQASAGIEVLIPDFNGSRDALDVVLQARPDVLNHNIETIPRLYPKIVPKKRYDRSLGIIEYAKRHGFKTKTGLMLGMGETRGEVLAVLQDLRRRGCDLLTLGQYLPPTSKHWLRDEYIHPVEFNWYARLARQIGFKAVASGPLVRSSYHAKSLGPKVGATDLSNLRF